MNLAHKYNIAAPRYTSYPTVPYWDNNVNQEQWVQHIKQAIIKHNNNNGISLYIHLPYCESLCTYCACNTRITVNHKVEQPYITTLLKEWQLYLNAFNGTPIFKGHSLTAEDLIIRQHILNLICTHQTNKDQYFDTINEKFDEFVTGGLIENTA